VIAHQVGGDVAPHEVGLGEAVQEHDRGAGAADGDVERHAVGDAELVVVESVESHDVSVQPGGQRPVSGD
jgi:hypothetical protein